MPIDETQDTTTTDTTTDEISAIVDRIEANRAAARGQQSPTEEESTGDDETTSEEGEEASTPEDDEEKEDGADGEEEKDAGKKEEPEPESKRIAALARREARLVHRQQELQRARQQLEQERQQLRQLAELPALAKRDPLAALQALGATYEQVTEALISGGAAAPAPVTKDDLAEMEMRLREEREQLERQRAIDGLRREIDDTIKADPDQYELITLHGQSNLVLEVIEEAFNQHGKLLSTKEAADLVEQHLEEQAQKLLSAKKLGAKRDAPKEAPKPKTKPAERRSIGGMGTSAASKAADTAFGDDEDADFQRAIAAFHKARAR